MSDAAYRKRAGDRKEGRRLRSLPGLNQFMPFIMIKRNDATNQFTDKVEVTDTDRWLRAKRAEGYKGMGMLHLFIAAYIRTIAFCPGLNRFVSGQRIFQRRNIQIIMAVKRGLTTDASETMIKVEFEPSDTIFDIYRKMSRAIEEVKVDEEGNGTEQTANRLMRLPTLLLKFVVWVMNLMDYFDWLPQSLLNVSPFHGSMIITDLGSLGIPPIYHHLYNFGNLPVFLSFGAKRHVYEMDRHGAVAERKYIDFKVVTDERTIDGSYYASAFKYMRYFLKNPQELESPPEKILRDVF